MDRPAAEVELRRNRAACKFLEEIVLELEREFQELHEIQNWLEEQPLRLVYGYHHQVDALMEDLLSVRLANVLTAKFSCLGECRRLCRELGIELEPGEVIEEVEEGEEEEEKEGEEEQL